MATFSTLEALETLCRSIPDWSTRLEELNGQITLRQAELARLEENERPSTRSAKNKGSTESLRPKGQHENPFLSNETVDIQMNPFDTPKSNHNGFSSTSRPSPPTPRATNTPPSSEPSAKPRSPRETVPRNPSEMTPSRASRPSPAVLRKRKTESLASGGSLVPKYRTRSMIIVYYDSAVQHSFEELVKFISASRNAMRKGKMAARMAKMKRAAELEVGYEESSQKGISDIMTSNTKLVGEANGSASKDSIKPSSGVSGLPNSDTIDDLPLPNLKFISTRQMGPSKDARGPIRADPMLGGGIFRSYRRSGADEAPDIFDELDKGLEWCQAQCEHAAHQFLRDGDCSAEIANIKKRLLEVKESALKETEKLEKEKDTSPAIPLVDPAQERRSYQNLMPQMRRDIGEYTAAQIHMEVDDAEVDDDDDASDDMVPVDLVFKRSKDLVS